MARRLESWMQQARRRKALVAVVVSAMGVLVVFIAGTFWWSRAKREAPRRLPEPPPAEVRQQLSGYTFTRSDGGRVVFTIRAARTVAFKEGGTTVLEDVQVEFFGRTGDRRDLLRTHRCDYNPNSGDLMTSGDVEITLNAPPEDDAGTQGRMTVHLLTSKLSLRERGALVASDEPVTFRTGSATGTAKGMAYGTREGWLELKSEVHAEWWLGEGEDAPPPVRLRASRAFYDKRAGTVQLSGPVEFTQGNRRVGSASGTLSLDERNRISRATLEGGVRASDEGERARLEASAERVRGEFDTESGNLVLAEAIGSLKVRSERPGSTSDLRAQAGQVRFAGRPPQPLAGRAIGDVKLKVESASAPLAAAVPSATGVETKELSATEIEFAFRPGGKSLRDARAVDEGTLVIVPADGRVGRRVAKAREMVMAFDQNNRLESLRGTGETEVIFHPAPSARAEAEPAISRADRLTAEFDPATQSLRAAQQTGNYRFREGAREARAERAEYSARWEVLTLEGEPELWDATARVKAEQISFNPARDTAEAAGQVQATYVESSGPANARRAATNVLADRMTADRQSGFARYEGNVRVWQGHDVLESSELEIFAESRRVRSASRVRTSHLRPGAPGPSAGEQADPQPVVIEADELDSFDQGRRARYRGNVVLRAAKTTLVADRMDVVFREGSSSEAAEVERAVAEGNVRVEQPLRRATGQHAEYFAAEGRIELTGGPPALYDAEKGFTTGRRLTFLIHDDTLRVDGAQQSPTISKHRVTQ